MLTLRNSTDIPNSLVHIAVAHGLKGLDEADKIELDTIILRDKRKAIIHGNWGWYYSRHHKYGRCIVLNVPDSKMFNGKPIERRKDGYNLVLHSRVEFLIMVMAHELRHAYQYQIKKQGGMRSAWLEKDARLWERVKLLSWQNYIHNIQQKAACNG